MQELRGEERSSRAWLWTSVSADAVCFHIDASRSAEAGLKLFAEARSDTVIACDRYSAYKRLVRLLEDKMILSFCWSHARRDFVDCAAGQVRLTQWCQGWIERIAEIFRLNDTRLKHYDPGLGLQTPPFDATQDDLEKAVERLFADAELAALPDAARVRFLAKHREGLCVFVDKPHVPSTNNFCRENLARSGNRTEVELRFRQRGRCQVHRDHVLRRGHALDERHRRPALAEGVRRERRPADLSPWLPWSMSEERRRELAAPG